MRGTRPEIPTHSTLLDLYDLVHVSIYAGVAMGWEQAATRFEWGGNAVAQERRWERLKQRLRALRVPYRFVDWEGKPWTHDSIFVRLTTGDGACGQHAPSDGRLKFGPDALVRVRRLCDDSAAARRETLALQRLFALTPYEKKLACDQERKFRSEQCA